MEVGILKMPPEINTFGRYVKVYFIAVFLVILVSGLVLPLYALGHHDPILYVNGWDEENYLTFPAANTMKAIYGYYGEWFVSFAIGQLNLSGSDINLLSDFFLFPVTLILTAVALMRFLKIELALALLYTLVIFFAGLLVNYSNPAVFYYFPQRFYHPVSFGWEKSSALMRTPNPQWTYFLIALVAYLISHMREVLSRFALLASLLPFLYVYTAVVYLFLLCQLSGIFIFSKLKFFQSNELAWLRVTIIGVIAWVGMGASLWLLRPFVESFSSGYGFFIKTHAPVITVHFIIAAAIGGIFLMTKVVRLRQCHQPSAMAWLACLLALLALSNGQIIAGYHMALKNFIDYGMNIVFGLYLVLSLEILKSVAPNAFKRSAVISTAVLLIFVLHADNFSFDTLKWRIYVDARISSADLERVRANPCASVITNRNLAAKLAYGLPLKKHLPFAYQQQFALPGGDLSYHVYLLDKLLPQVSSAERKYLISQKDLIQKLAKNKQDATAINHRVVSRCGLADIADNQSIKVIPLVEKPRKIHVGLLDLLKFN